MGVISLYLGENPKRRIVGIDLDINKIEAVQKNNHNSNITFIQADAARFVYKPFNGAVLSDFLHHVNFATQEKILSRITSALDKKGVILIKEIDKNDGIRMWLSRFWDLLFYPADKIYYRKKNDLKKFLISLGLNVSIKREVPWFPGSTILFICQKS